MVIELCRLARDVELSTVSIDGVNKSVLNNAVAIKFDKDKTAFVNITAWGKPAEAIAKYLKKGDELLIRGELRNQKSKYKEVDITTVYILVTSFDFTHGKKRESGQEVNTDIPIEE